MEKSVQLRQKGIEFINAHRQVTSNVDGMVDWINRNQPLGWQQAELITSLITKKDAIEQFYNDNSILVISLLDQPIPSRTFRAAGSVPPSFATILACSPNTPAHLNIAALKRIIADNGHSNSGHSVLTGQCEKGDVDGITLCLEHKLWKDMSELDTCYKEYVSKSLSLSDGQEIISVLQKFHSNGIRGFDVELFGSKISSLYLNAGLDEVSSFLTSEMLTAVVEDAAKSIAIPAVQLEEQIIMANSL